MVTAWRLDTPSHATQHEGQTCSSAPSSATPTQPQGLVENTGIVTVLYSQLKQAF